MTCERLADLCLKKPGAYEDYPFGDDTACYKVRGKIFAQIFSLRGERKATFKCEPILADLFRQKYPGSVTRGYHCPPVQQPYWNTVSLDGSVPDDELRMMLDHAYNAVVAKLPRKLQKELAGKTDQEVIVERRDNLSRYYETENNEDNRLRSRGGQIEYRTTIKFLKQYCLPGLRVLDCCAGCGAYAFPLAEFGCKVTAGDPVEHNVRQIRAKQEQFPILEQVYIGDAMDLSRFESSSFDAVLNLGAFYHLTQEIDRRRTIEECLRVLRKGGILFLAYLSRYSNIIKFHSLWNADFTLFEDYLKDGFSGKDLFYAASPEEVESLMSSYAVEPLHFVAADGPRFVFQDAVSEMDDALFERYMKLHLAMCEIPSLLGYSEHGLYICRKR